MTAKIAPEPEFVPTISIEDIPAGKYARHVVDGHDLLIVRLKDEIHIVENLCSHQRQPLLRGRIIGGSISCPVHGGMFDLKTGCAVKFPASRPIRTYVSRVVDGIVEVALGA